MIDPARPEAREAVAMCKTAGIRPVTITGDHPITALAIARELGIAADGSALTGLDLDRLPAAELARHVDEVALFARVAPEHKLRIVQAQQQRGLIVAKTGDGVNDGPALKAADIGVVMGMAGTDVAKEAGDPRLKEGLMRNRHHACRAAPSPCGERAPSPCGYLANSPPG